jgi:hypothetical protein
MLFDRSNTASRPLKAGVLLVASFALIATPMGAQAAPLAASSAGKSQLVQASDTIEFGARKRYRRGGGNAAGLAMMGMMIGTIGTMIAAQRRRDAYDEAYNRAYASHYPYGYAHQQPYAYHHHPRVYHQPQVYHRPHVHHHRPHVHHHHRHMHHGHAPVARVINKAMFHR